MSRRAVLWTAGAVLVGVAIAITLFTVGRSKPPATAVATTTVSRGTVTLQVSASGTVQAAQSRGLSFSMAGTVTEVDVAPGTTVKSGQVLAKIDPTTAEANVTSAQQRVSDASDAVTRAEQTAALPACPPRLLAPPPAPAAPALAVPAAGAVRVAAAVRAAAGQPRIRRPARPRPRSTRAPH
jgi:HlyD family secretion protein